MLRRFGGIQLLAIERGGQAGEVYPGLAIDAPRLGRGLNGRLVVERSGLHREDACGLSEGRHNRRSTVAAEAPLNVDLRPVVVGLAVGLEFTLDSELRLVDHDIDRERSAALALAMVAVAYDRREKVTGDLVPDSTAETTSCLHDAYRSGPAGAAERRSAGLPTWRLQFTL
jgi:hypothetical protein